MTLEDDGDHRVEGSLEHQIREAAEIMTRLMPKWRQLAQSGLFEPTHRIPQAAWLEGLANAVTQLSLASVMGPPCCHEDGTTWKCYRAWRTSFRGSTVTRPRCR